MADFIQFVICAATLAGFVTFVYRDNMKGPTNGKP